jgi:hypothetical protein
MRVFAIRIEHALHVTIERRHARQSQANIVEPSRSTTSIRAWIVT